MGVNTKVYIPNIDTKTGDVFRVSASGNVIETVSTDPRLVPSHSVGMSADGSIGKIKQKQVYSISREKMIFP